MSNDEVLSLYGLSAAAQNSMKHHPEIPSFLDIEYRIFDIQHAGGVHLSNIARTIDSALLTSPLEG